MKMAPPWIAACVLAALIGTAWTRQHSVLARANQAEATPDPSAPSGSSPQPSPELSEAQAQEFFRASKLLGKPTRTQTGQKAGKIQDVVFNQQGEIFALVDVGNSRWAAVPWQLANTARTKGDQALVLNTTAEALKNAPAVTKDQWGALNNPNFTKGIYSYFKLEPITTMGGGGDEASR